MRYGIISDIHSNLEALEVALDSLKDVDALVCVGDIVGYGPNPNECCDIIRERRIPTVLGNHDAAITNRTTLEWFNSFARQAIEWTLTRLSDINKAYLESLPLVYESEHFIIVHGSLSEPKRFDYIISPWEARVTFAEMGKHNLCFIGHTHLAEYYAQDVNDIGTHRIDMSSGGMIEMKPMFTYIVNSGSIGQPRDRNARTSFAVYDTEAETVEIRRLEYPIEVTQRKMIDAGLPEELASRLELGM